MVDMLTAVALLPNAPSEVSLPPNMDENAVRAVFEKAAQEGKSIEDLGQTITLGETPQGQSTPAPQVPSVNQPQPVAPPAQNEVPKKFQKPDGTVDEDKLKASSDALNDAIQKKTKTVDELMADYKAREKQLQQLNEQVSQIKRNIPAAPTPAQPNPDVQVQYQQIMQDYQRDPIGTIFGLAQVVAKQENAPLMEVVERIQERERDGSMRDNVAQLAQSDSRILDPRVYPVFKAELESDPGYMRLKNPHKAAWNEVKERLRLGEPRGASAQPSNTSGTLIPGAPPSVSQLPSPMTPQSMAQGVDTLNPYSEEGKRLEDQMREAFRTLGGGF